MNNRALASGIVLLVLLACDDDRDEQFVEESYRHVRAAWSPDGLTIAFTASIGGVTGIYLVDSSGFNVRLLKSGDGIGLAWSPDSRWIGFSAIGTLYKVLATGDSIAQLTTGGTDYRPSWSPDGSRIAFVRTGLKILDLPTGFVNDLLSYGDFPSWHPNGTKVVFMTSSVSQIYYEFAAVTPGTSQVESYYSFSIASKCLLSSMSPTGQEIVFSARPLDDRSRTQVMKHQISSSSLVQLTDDGGDQPAWSPDGSRIVYTRTASGDGGLWIMNADGSGKRRLTQP